jgi:ribonuclease HII
MNYSVSAGIDEAGRGPVIGPMVIACALFNHESREKVKELKVRDSKKLTPKRRQLLEPLIKSQALEWKSIHIQAKDIDFLRKTKSLNQIEAEYSAKLILSCETKIDAIYIDAADNIAEKYKNRIIDAIKDFNPRYDIPNITCEHRADDTYMEASAASIIAKVERDREIEKLRKTWGEFGSGYPSDPLTQEFLKELKKTGKYPDFIRKSWATVSNEKQSKLADY